MVLIAIVAPVSIAGFQSQYHRAMAQHRGLVI
jgi:hypothetical protein